MAARTRAQKEARVCQAGIHPWIESQKRCNDCINSRLRQQRRERYQNDPEYREKQRARSRENSRKLRLSPEFCEAKREYAHQLWHNNIEFREHRREYEQNRRKEDPQFRLAHNLRVRLRRAVKRGYKSGSAVSDLGCSVKELKLHIERLWQAEMSWDNYGYGLDKWHIDHIEPLSSFDLTNREQLLEACNYRNLQPLWQSDNLKKGSKVI